jgi:hypothetical protein
MQLNTSYFLANLFYDSFVIYSLLALFSIGFIEHNKLDNKTQKHKHSSERSVVGLKYLVRLTHLSSLITSKQVIGRRRIAEASFKVNCILYICEPWHFKTQYRKLNMLTA